MGISINKNEDIMEQLEKILSKTHSDLIKEAMSKADSYDQAILDLTKEREKYARLNQDFITATQKLQKFQSTVDSIEKREERVASLERGMEVFELKTKLECEVRSNNDLKHLIEMAFRNPTIVKNGFHSRQELDRNGYLQNLSNSSGEETTIR